MSEERSSEQSGKSKGDMPPQSSGERANSSTNQPPKPTREDESPVRAFTPGTSATGSSVSGSSKSVDATPDVPASAGGAVGAGGAERPVGQRPAPVGSTQGGAGPTSGAMTDRPAMSGRQEPQSPTGNAHGSTDRSIAESAHQRQESAGKPASGPGTAGSERFGDQIVGDLGWAGSAIRDEASSLPGTPGAAWGGDKTGNKATNAVRSVTSNLPTEQMSGFLGTVAAMARERPLAVVFMALAAGFFLGRMTRS